MAYDLELAAQVREIVAEQPDVEEKKMFGGLAFLLHGRMTVAASGQGGLLLRIDPALADELVADERASRMIMRGREMDGWLHVVLHPADGEDELRRWVAYGVEFAGTLPPKR